MRVMVVEDDVDMRRLIRLRLEYAGHEVLEAEAAPEAMGLLDGPPIEAALATTCCRA